MSNAILLGLIRLEARSDIILCVAALLPFSLHGEIRHPGRLRLVKPWDIRLNVKRAVELRAAK